MDSLQYRHVFFFFLKESTSSLETRFLLADNLYCKASVPPTDKVCLWLGVSQCHCHSFLGWHLVRQCVFPSMAVLERSTWPWTEWRGSIAGDWEYEKDCCRNMLESLPVKTKWTKTRLSLQLALYLLNVTEGIVEPQIDVCSLSEFMSSGKISLNIRGNRLL